jgi:hypothetical protein
VASLLLPSYLKLWMRTVPIMQVAEMAEQEDRDGGADAGRGKAAMKAQVAVKAEKV